MVIRKKEGTDLFIVDNSDKEWKVLQYLKEWADISSSFDIATGYFEIGSLLGLDGDWQKLDKIRILMGDEITQRTRDAILIGINKKYKILDESIELEKEKNDFLIGTPAIVEAIKNRKIECRVYTKNKFHAKSYITHGKHRVVGSSALVGSSNFTLMGLTGNVELNIQVQREVEELQEWFEDHWNEADDVSDELFKVIERHTKEYTPFEIYLKALQQFCNGHMITANEWEKRGKENNGSKIYPILANYQREGYRALINIAQKYSGAFLCDGVGLGKTFIGMMLIERLVVYDRKRVVLFVPKAAKESVWEATLSNYLPDVLDGFYSFMIFSHTDLQSERPSLRRRLQNASEQADVVIIDEAHHFRNLGNKGGGKKRKSRYWEMYDLCKNKNVYMLTATPINNKLNDLQHMIELFSQENKSHFSSIGIQSLAGHFKKMEKSLDKQLDIDTEHETFDTNVIEAEDVLISDRLFQEVVIQRSRTFVKKSQELEGDNDAVFPNREIPHVCNYSIKKVYGNILEMVEGAFDKEKPLFSLAIYDPYSYYIGEPKDLEKPEIAMKVGRLKQVVSLIRIQFLKRFESSCRAFEVSCWDMLKRLIAFVEKHNISGGPQKRFERWKLQNSNLLEYMKNNPKRLWGIESDEEDSGSILSSDIIDDVDELDSKLFDIKEIIEETISDMNEICKFLNVLIKIEVEHDDKINSFIDLLKTDPVLKKHKVIIFTEYLTTARYLYKSLIDHGFNKVDEIDGSTTKNRLDIIRKFSPYYNGTSSKELKNKGVTETRILISTDVLAEGLNLQDATRLINYDLHWNPVKLMQRIGRIDRRLNQDYEAKIVRDNPDCKNIRGTAAYWNFLPPDELDGILKLYGKVSRKVLRISKSLGIEGGKLLRPDDDYEVLKNFNQTYEGETSTTEDIRLEYQSLLKNYPEIENMVNNLPGKVFSGKEALKKESRFVFFCYILPAPDKSKGNEWTIEAGNTQWFLYEIGKEEEKKYLPLTSIERIIKLIRTNPKTPRQCKTDQSTLKKIREKMEKHIKNKYLKPAQAPIGAKPKLICWMEIA